MTPDEIRQVIDTEARERMGISGDEFIERWRQHDLPDILPVAEIGMMVRLLGVGRE